MPPTLNIWPTGANAYTDYSAWLLDEGGKELLSKTHALSAPQQLKFTLTDGIPGFIAPDAGNRVQVLTQRYGTWFQGYLSQVPVRRLIGGRLGQNMLLWSEAFDNAAWVFNGAGNVGGTITPNSVVDPNGNLTADALIPSGGTTDAYIYQLWSSQRGQTVTLSAWLRVPSGTKTVGMFIRDSAVAVQANRSCNLTTTWQRFSLTLTALSNGNAGRAYVAGTGASWLTGEVDVWGAQLEVGAFAGPYLPTQGTPLPSGAPIYAYDCVAISEELRLEWSNSSVFPTLSPFANMTQGAIVKAMIAALDTGARYALSAAMLTNAGFSGFNAAQLVDGDVTTNGFSNNTTNAGSTITIDLGVGIAVPFVRARLYASTAAQTQTYRIFYSDNGSTFVDAAPGVVFAPTLLGWNTVNLAINTPHRYWRLQAVSTITAAGFVNEMEFYAALDVTNVQAGTTIPFFRVRPDEAFMDAVRRLSDKTNMAFWTKGGLAFYAPYNATPFPFTPDDAAADFDPTALDVQPVQNPVFNDVFAQGVQEPQAYATEHFPGDGLTAQFPLKLPAYGMSSQLLLIDDFTAGTLDATKWLRTDVNGILSFTAGSLSLVAATSTLVSRLTSVLGLEIAGTLDLCAGRVTFAAGSNTLLGCLMSADTGVLAQVIAGFQCVPESGQTRLKPVVSGAAFGAGYLTLAGMNYQFRLTVDCSLAVRVRRPYFSLFNSYGGGTDTADAIVTFSIVESSNFNPDGGAVEVLTASATITGIAAFLFYTLVAGPQNTSDAVNLALNFCSLRKPVQAMLWTRRQSTVVELVENGDFEQSSVIPPPTWVATNATLSYDTTTQHAGARSLIVTASATNGSATRVFNIFPNHGTLAEGYPGKLYTLSAWCKTVAGKTGAVVLNFYDTAIGLLSSITATTTSAAWTQLSVSGVAPANTVWIQIQVRVNDVGGGVAEFDDVTCTGPNPFWRRYRIGDKSDPLARALLTTGSDNNALLEFIGDQAPQPMETVKIQYRSAGIARARISSAASITAEAAKAGDSGVRTGTLPAQSPTPRDATELERACQAYIDDRTRALFSGKWTINAKAYPSNLLAQSQAMQTSPWAGGGVGGSPVVTGNAAVAPDGTLTAASIAFPNTAGGESFLGQSSGVVPIIGRFYTFSVWIMAAASVNGWIRLVQTTGENDIVVPIAVTQTWQRFSMTIHPSSVGTGALQARFQQPGTNPATTIFAWGAQLELGSVPNAYEPTTTTATTEPLSGELLTVNAVTRFPQFQALVTEVNSRLIVQQPDGTEYYEQDVVFGPLLRLDEISFDFRPAEEAIIGPLDQLQPQLPIDVASVGASFASDRPKTLYAGKTGAVISIDTCSAPTSAYEVRKTDAAWGVAAATNKALTPDPTTEQFSIARVARDFSVFIKNRDGAGLLSRYPAFLRFVWPLIPPAPVTTYSVPDPLHIKVNLALPLDPLQASDVFGVEIRDSDNATVLYNYSDVLLNTDPFGAGLSYVWNNTTAVTTKTLYCYLFNLLGEYSPATVLTIDLGSAQFGGAAYGPNLLVNPGWEVSSAIYPTGQQAGTGQYLTDGWVATNSAPQFAYGVETSVFPHTGIHNGIISLKTGQAVANGATIYGVFFNPVNSTANKIKFIPVRGGDTYYFGGWLRWDTNVGALPAGVTGQCYLQLVFLDAAGVDLGLYVSPPPVLAASGGYVFRSAIAVVPATAAFMLFQCVSSITNASGSTFNTSTFLYQDNRFDDCFLEQRASPVVPSDPTAVTCTSGSATALTRGDGIRISRIKVAWTASTLNFDGANGFVDIEVSATGINAWLHAATVSGDKLIGYVTGIDDGIGYDVRIRSRNTTGGTSAWVQVTNHIVGIITHGALTYRPTSNPLTATDAGATATINIAAWTMRITGVGDKSYTASGSITGLSYNTLYYVYYDDTTLAAGAVTVSATTTKSTALGTSAGRYFLGSITTPRATAPDTVGNGDGGVGAQGGMLNIYQMSVQGGTGASGSGTLTNPLNSIDGDLTTFTVLAAAQPAGGSSQISLYGPPGLTRAYPSTVTLNISLSITQLNASVGAGGTPYVQIYYALKGPDNTGNYVSWQTYNSPGATFGRLTLSRTLPAGQNLAQVGILIVVQCPGGVGTTGGISANVYEAWIEAQE